MKLAPLFVCFAVIAGSMVSTQAAARSYRSVGYVEEWAQYRTGNCQFSFSDINPNLYTHLIYAFAQVGGQNGNYTIVPLEDNGVSQSQVAASYAAFQALKQQNPQLKTLLSVGGAKFSNDPSTSWIWSAMASTKSSRQTFAANAVHYARATGFDGIDIDWEYPGSQQSQDANNFTLLMDDLRIAISQDATNNGTPPLLLTIAAPATSNDYGPIQLGLVAQQVDFINLMAYDYHGSWESQTGALAPLMMDAAPDSDLDDLHTVQDYLAAGVPSDKIVLGLAAYGRTYADVGRSSMNIDSNGGGEPGPCTCEQGLLSYTEILRAQEKGSYKTSWDPISMTPFAYNHENGTWVTYENELSIQMKLLYIQEQRLGGAMLWSVDSDAPAYGFPLSSVVQQTLLAH